MFMRFARGIGLVGVCLVGGALQACGGCNDGVTAPVSSTTEPVQERDELTLDPRLSHADQLVQARRWRDAVRSLRAIIHDANAPASLRQEAERQIIAAWLAFEAQDAHPDLGCIEAQEQTAPASARMLARAEARRLLEQLGADQTTEQLRTRLDALDAQDRSACETRGGTLGVVNDVRVEGVPYIDQRMGVPSSTHFGRTFGFGGGALGKVRSERPAQVNRTEPN